MCGITGIYNYKTTKPVNEGVLKKMRDTMVHRGPDGAGVWISPDKRLGLGHRRLAIIDLADSAGQPMSNEDGTIWIVSNGEIYNHEKLRTELEKLGHRFKTDHSDTEVIIHAFEQWREDCVDRFRGMFAFCIWDDKRKELVLFRDRIGIKPLYYTNQCGKLIFASEIKAILAHPDIPRAVDEEAFYHYLSFLTTPPPQTLFKGIMKLPAGCWARIKNNGSVEIKRYWELWEHTIPLVGISESEIASRLLEELREAVTLRKVSDVPVGIFLSGGIDSSTNAVLFSEEETSPVKTFSIGYDRQYQSYQNEFQYARRMAELVGAKHYEKRLNLDNLIDFLPKLIYHQDEPIADPVCVPVYYISKLARDSGIKVCQVGEGGDELFCGYSGWKRFIKLQNLSHLPLTAPFRKIILALLKKAGKDQETYYEWLRRGVSDQPIFWGGAEAFTQEQKKRLLSKRLKKKFAKLSSYEVIKPILERFQKKAWEKTPLNWMSYLDLNFRLPELLLMRVDKMSMAASLEARVPFLDHKFVELAMSIPARLKTKNNELKYIFKKAVSPLVPDEIINRKKQGFNVPLYEWFFQELGSYSREKIISFTKRTDFFDHSYIEELFKRNKFFQLWYILNFVLWHEYWIEKQ